MLVLITITRFLLKLDILCRRRVVRLQFRTFVLLLNITVATLIGYVLVSPRNILIPWHLVTATLGALRMCLKRRVRLVAMVRLLVVDARVGCGRLLILEMFLRVTLNGLI